VGCEEAAKCLICGWRRSKSELLAIARYRAEIPAPSEEAEKQEELGRQRKRFDALPVEEELRDRVLELYNQGMMYKEIAVTIGRSRDAVGAIIHKARKRGLLTERRIENWRGKNEVRSMNGEKIHNSSFNTQNCLSGEVKG